MLFKHRHILTVHTQTPHFFLECVWVPRQAALAWPEGDSDYPPSPGRQSSSETCFGLRGLHAPLSPTARSEGAAEKKKKALGRTPAPSSHLATTPSPPKPLQLVTAGRLPKALLGLLQEFPACDSPPSSPLHRELAGGQAPRRVGGQSRVPPSTVGALISCTLRGPVWVMSQPALERYRGESHSACARSLWGQTQFPPTPVQLRELGPNELEPHAFT